LAREYPVSSARDSGVVADHLDIVNELAGGQTRG
jgi:hypothetical protein